MKIIEVERFGEEELLSAIRGVRLRGFDGVALYAEADITLETFDTADLAPAQRFVLRHGVEKIHELRGALLDKGIDIFELQGGLWVTNDDDVNERIPVIPPIVEESHEPDGRVVMIVNDGMHRVYAAREAGRPINVVAVRGVSAEYPYYALALENGWAGVSAMDDLPDGFQKKEYRIPTNYKALFRDFNAEFPGVQKQRKQTNPDHLRA